MRTFCRSCFPLVKWLWCSLLALFLDQKLDVQDDGTILIDSENKKGSPSSLEALASDPSYEFKHRRSSSRRNNELSPTSSSITEATQSGDLISGTKLLAVSFTCFGYFYILTLTLRSFVEISVLLDPFLKKVIFIRVLSLFYFCLVASRNMRP